MLNQIEISNVSAIPVVYWQDQAVVTTETLANVYGTTSKILSQNFNRNQERFVEGKHYFKLTGLRLRDFREYSSLRGLVITKNSPSALLWTELGAVRHAKMLGTDKAWEVQEVLEDFYFSRKEEPSDPVPLRLELDLETKAKILDRFIDTGNYIELDDFAKTIGIGPNILTKKMRGDGYLQKTTKRRRVMQRYLDSGDLKQSFTVGIDREGEAHINGSTIGISPQLMRTLTMKYVIH